MTSNDDIDEQQHIISELDEISYLSAFREESGCEMRPRCMVLQLIDSFSAARKVASPSIFKQVIFNAKAWRISHPVRRDHHLAPELPHWAFPQVLITRHNLEIDVGVAGDTLLACTPGHRASLGVSKGQFAALRCC